MIDITCYILRYQLIYIILLQGEVFGCASRWGRKESVCVWYWRNFARGELILKLKLLHRYELNLFKQLIFEFLLFFV